MRRFVTTLVSVVASLSLVACGSDASTSDVGAAPVEQNDTAPLLIDALPEISGPTVLWFWAPG